MEKIKSITIGEYDYNESFEAIESSLRNVSKKIFDLYSKEIVKVSYKDGIVDNIWYSIYDNNGLLVQSFSEGDSMYKYEYDERGNQISKAFYRDGELEFKTQLEFKYDSKGNILVEHDGGGQRTYYSYNELGELIKKEYQMSNGVYRLEENFKNDKLFIEKSFNPHNGIMTSEKTFLYNKNGDAELISLLFLDGKTYNDSYKFEYDKNRNWTKRITLEERYSNLKLTKREIEYYN